MRFRRGPSLIVTIGASLALYACWLPPAEVIREKTEMRKQWREQAKLRTKLRAKIPVEASRVSTSPNIATLSVDVPDFGDDKMSTSTPSPSPRVEKPRKISKIAEHNRNSPPKEQTRQAAQVTPVEGVANLVSLTRPSSPLAVDAPWQDGLELALLTRIDDWRARFDADVEAVLARGEGISIAKGGRLFESDAAMLYGMMPPGLYDCQLFTINDTVAPFAESETGKCRVAANGDTRQFSFLTTTETILGQLHDNDAFTGIYIGKGLGAAINAAFDVPIVETAPAEIGVVQRVADTRWRIIIPGDGAQGSMVLELTRPRMGE